ncbi:MAG: hypothetical protein ACLP5H_21660 [Desulfomonilaceae bacterium]
MTMKLIPEKLAQETAGSSVGTCGALIWLKEEMKESLLEGEDINAIIELLKMGKGDVDFEYCADAMYGAINWAKDADYYLVQYALLFEPTRQHHLAHANYYLDVLLKDKLLGYLFTEAFSEDPLLTANEDGVLNDFARMWFLSWKEGIKIFWEGVKDKL